jgi:hypothetical protein
MNGLLCFVLAVLASPFKSKLRLEAENAVLRHRLIIVRRRLPGRVRLINHDRWFLIQLYRWFPLNPACSHNHPARDARGLAQGRLSLLLALEVAPTGRATADPHGATRIDTADERRKSALGVRRAKAALSSGCKSHPATAPAGSNRSSHGGNKVAEASG